MKDKNRKKRINKKSIPRQTPATCQVVRDLALFIVGGKELFTTVHGMKSPKRSWFQSSGDNSNLFLKTNLLCRPVSFIFLTWSFQSTASDLGDPNVFSADRS